MTQQNFAPVSPAPETPVQRPFFKKKRFIIPAGVLFAGIMLGSCSSGGSGPADGGGEAPVSTADASAAAAPASAAATPAAAPAPAAPTVGKPFTVDVGNGNVARITIVSAVRTDTVSMTAFASPPKNGTYLLLDVLWETEKGTTSSNPLYFTAKDANGRKADISIFADNQLGSGDVLAGDKSRGFVAFDMAPGAATVMITDPMLQEAARIQIP
jgi:hypothetical protein